MTRPERNDLETLSRQACDAGQQFAHSRRWLLRFNARPDARIHLLCFAHAGGAGVVYREWASALPAHTEVLAVELPGRGSRLLEPAIDRMDALVEQVLGVVGSTLERPCVLLGHSFGALLAFEVARTLRALNQPRPLGLIVSACAAPHLIVSSFPGSERSDEHLVAELCRLGGTPAAVLADSEMVGLLIPAFRADLRMMDRYVRLHSPQPPLDIPITVLGGQADPLVDQTNLAEWRSHTSAGFSVHMFSGDHFYIHAQRDAVWKVVAAELNRIVDGLS